MIQTKIGIIRALHHFAELINMLEPICFEVSDSYKVFNALLSA